MNKVVFVKSYGAPTGEETMTFAETGKVGMGLSGKEEPAVKLEKRKIISDCKIDGARLASDIESKINELSNQGYELLAISNVTSGDYDWDAGYGFSYTEGVNLIFKKVI